MGGRGGAFCISAIQYCICKEQLPICSYCSQPQPSPSLPPSLPDTSQIEVYQSEQRQEPFHPLQHCAAPGTYQNSSEMAIQHLPYAQQLQQQQSLTYGTTPGTLGFRPTFESTPQEAGESFAEVGYRDQRRHPLPAEPPSLQTSPRRRVNLDPVSSKIPIAVSRGQQDRQTHGLKEPRQSMPSLPPIMPKEKSLSAPQPKGRGEPQLRLPPVK